jgi:hypothetical protein
MLHRRFLVLWAMSAALSVAAAPAVTIAQEAGHWDITPLHRDGRVLASIELSFSYDRDSQMSLGPVPLSAFRGLTAAQLNGDASDARFTMPAPAGTVSFTGTVGHGSGSGDFTFAPNRAFGATLAQHGIQGGADDFDLFRLAIHDVTVGQVDTLVAALRRYDDVLPDANDLVRLLNHGVDAAVVADLGGAGLRGLEPGQIIRLVNHDVDGRYVQAVRAAGYGTSDVDRLVWLHNHGIALGGDARGKVKDGKRAGA